MPEQTGVLWPGLMRSFDWLWIPADIPLFAMSSCASHFPPREVFSLKSPQQPLTSALLVRQEAFTALRDVGGQRCGWKDPSFAFFSVLKVEFSYSVLKVEQFPASKLAKTVDYPGKGQGRWLSRIPPSASLWSHFPSSACPPRTNLKIKQRPLAPPRSSGHSPTLRHFRKRVPGSVKGKEPKWCWGSGDCHHTENTASKPIRRVDEPHTFPASELKESCLPGNKGSRGAADC